MIRKIVALAAGAAISVGLVSLIEYLGHRVYPVPADLNVYDSAMMAEYVMTLPLGAYAFVLGGWSVATLVGGWVAGLIAGDHPYLFAGFVGALMLVGSGITLVTIEHPTWFAITGVALIVAMTFVAGRLAYR